MWQKEENPYVLAEQFAADQTPDVDRAARRLIYVLDKEEPVLFEDERIAFTRTVTTIPEIFTKVLVKSFIDMGGHQLQLNSLNRDISGSYYSEDGADAGCLRKKSPRTIKSEVRQIS